MTGLRLSKRELFAAIGYQPHSGQIRVHRSKAPRRVLVCGARWGKSTCAAMEAVFALLDPREAAFGWVVGPTYALADLIFAKVVQTIHEHFRHRIIEYDRRGQRIVIRNLGGGRSELRAKSADNASSLLGDTLDFVILDEAAKLPARIWQGHIAQRLLDRKGWALIISTPRGLNWFYQLFKLGQKGRDPMFESWRSPTSENPHIDAATIEAERASLPPDSFAQEFEAVFEGEFEDPCERCGGPSQRPVASIIVHDDEPVPLCPACGGATHQDGTTAVWIASDGHPRQRVIHIIRGFDDRPPPELPGCEGPDQEPVRAP